MSTPTLPALPAEFLGRIHTLLARGPRQILGLVGPPGSGKSTLAAALLQAFPGVAQVVPMDGYHLANTELKRLGRAGRKGVSALVVPLPARRKAERRMASECH